MEIVATALEWAITDAEKWDAFLRTETGKRLIPKLAESAPALLPTGDTNAILIRTGEFRGFQIATQRLLDLTHESSEMKVVQDTTTNYPALENDAAWDDGKKLEPEAPKPATPDLL